MSEKTREVKKFQDTMYTQSLCGETIHKNIPILPEAFLTFASKSSAGPSYAANGQEDHKTYNRKNQNKKKKTKLVQT